VTPTDAKRYPEIDFLKGAACALMLFGHAIRMKTGTPDTFEKLFLHLADFSGPIFFFVSGMNVVTFMDRNEGRPGFDAAKFYVRSAALMFFLGYAYNFNRNTLGMMDIFQSVAVCTAAVYLLLRTRLPLWAHALIAVAIYGVYAQFRIRLELNLIVPGFHELKESIPAAFDAGQALHAGVAAELMRGLTRAQQFWFLYFTPLFWIIYFYAGALCFRGVTRAPRTAWRWAAFFGAIFLASPLLALRRVFGPQKSLLDALFLKNFVEMSIRGIPSYALMTLGGAGLAYLLGRRYYRGADAVPRGPARWLAARFEMLGKESLMFLVTHWLVISAVLTVSGAIVHAQIESGGTPREMNVYLRATLCLAITLFFVPWLARQRDRWSQRPHYVAGVVVAMVAALLLTIRAAFVNGPLAYFMSFGVAFGFAFLFPRLRGRLRAKFTAPAAVAANG
jgi:hypothetical protein